MNSNSTLIMLQMLIPGPIYTHIIYTLLIGLVIIHILDKF